MAKFTVGSVVLCDDVRREITNKDILIGVYGGGIMAPSLPAAIPLALWIEFTPKIIGPYSFDLKIRLPPGDSEIIMQLVTEFQSAGEPASIYTPQLICPIKESGSIDVFIKGTKDEGWILIKSKTVTLGAPATPATPIKVHYGEPPAVEDVTPLPETSDPHAVRRPKVRGRSAGVSNGN